MSDMDLGTIEDALAKAVEDRDWTVANQCADLLKKLRELSSPLTLSSKRWLPTDGELPVKIHPTEGEQNVVKSIAATPGGSDYL